MTDDLWLPAWCFRLRGTASACLAARGRKRAEELFRRAGGRSHCVSAVDADAKGIFRSLVALAIGRAATQGRLYDLSATGGLGRGLTSGQRCASATLLYKVCALPAASYFALSLR
jgi:hypothetical protein